MTVPVDFNALAALRPGEGQEMLQRAFGDRCRAPAPHQEGFVKSIERRHGVRARLDASGHELPALKKLTFHPRTAEQVAVVPLLRARGVTVRSR